MAVLRRLALAAVAVMAVHPAFALDAETAKTTVNQAFADGIAAFGSKKLSAEQRQTVLVGLIQRYSDTGIVSADILGRHWQKSATADQDAFRSTLMEYVTHSWTGSLDDVNAQTKLVLGTVEAKGDRFLVHGQAQEPGDQPTQIEAEVAPAADGHPVIVDFAADGVSLVRTMKADFSSILRNNGGKISGLIDAMKAKISGSKD